MERQINWLLIQNPSFIHIAVAPDFIVRDIHPPQSGNERIGRDVRETLFFRQVMTSAVSDQSARFYGPISIDSRDAFAIFFPVFVRENGERRLWGAVEVAIDQTMFYQATGLMLRHATARTGNAIRISTIFRSPSAISARRPRPMRLCRRRSSVRPISMTSIRCARRSALLKRQVGAFRGPEQRLERDTRKPHRVASDHPCRQLHHHRADLLRHPSARRAQSQYYRAGEARGKIAGTVAAAQSGAGILQYRHLGAGGSFEQPALGRPRSGSARQSGGRRKPNRSTNGWRRSCPRIVKPPKCISSAAALFSAACTAQYRILLGDGGIRHLRSVGAFYTDAYGGVSKTIGIVWDVTADAVTTDTLRKAKDMSEVKNAELELALEELSSREGQLAELSSLARPGAQLLSVRHMGGAARPRRLDLERADARALRACAAQRLHDRGDLA